jgi:hypothetical protein
MTRSSLRGRFMIRAIQPWIVPFALILAALIIGSAIFMSHVEPRYAISTIPEPEGTYAAWRLDTWSGEVRLCTFAPSPNPFDKFDPEPHAPRVKIVCREELGGTTVLPPKP